VGGASASGLVPLAKCTVPLPRGVVPLPEDAVPLPEDAVPLPEDAVPLPKDTVPLPEDAVPLPEDAVPLPEDAVPLPEDTVPPLEGMVPLPKDTVPSPESAVPLPKDAVPLPEDAVPLPEGHGSSARGHGSSANGNGASGSGHGSFADVRWPWVAKRRCTRARRRAGQGSPALCAGFAIRGLVAAEAATTTVPIPYLIPASCSLRRPPPRPHSHYPNQNPAPSAGLGCSSAPSRAFCTASGCHRNVQSQVAGEAGVRTVAPVFRRGKPVHPISQARFSGRKTGFRTILCRPLKRAPDLWRLAFPRLKAGAWRLDVQYRYLESTFTDRWRTQREARRDLRPPYYPDIVGIGNRWQPVLRT